MNPKFYKLKAHHIQLLQDVWRFGIVEKTTLQNFRDILRRVVEMSVESAKMNIESASIILQLDPSIDDQHQELLKRSRGYRESVDRIGRNGENADHFAETIYKLIEPIAESILKGEPFYLFLTTGFDDICLNCSNDVYEGSAGEHCQEVTNKLIGDKTFDEIFVQGAIDTLPKECLRVVPKGVIVKGNCLTPESLELIISRALQIYKECRLSEENSIKLK